MISIPRRTRIQSAAVEGVLVGRGRRSGAEQLAAARQLLRLDAIGQQAVMSDAQKAVRKHVFEEAVDEFLGRKEIRLQAVAIAAVPVSVAGTVSARL